MPIRDWLSAMWSEPSALASALAVAIAIWVGTSILLSAWRWWDEKHGSSWWHSRDRQTERMRAARRGEE